MTQHLRRTLSRATLAAACALTAAACDDGGAPLSPSPAGPTVPSLVAAVRCTAQVHAATVSCQQGDLPAGARGYIIVGGQHVNVDLTSSNVTYDGGTGSFAFDVTVKNLIPQPMGTTDGVAADSEGVRVVFATGPSVTGGSGDASVSNEDGSDAFTSTNQPFFRYAGADLGADGILSTSETSAARNWQLHVDSTVGSFAFTLYVVAEVPHPAGYIDLYPGATSLLAGDSTVVLDTVRTATGAAVTTHGVVWASADNTVATVDAGGKVKGVAVGSTVITASTNAGAVTGSFTVSVCPNLAVGAAYTAAMPGAASVCFGGGASGAEYTYMPVNLSSSSALSLSVTATGIQAVTGPPSPDRIPGGLKLGRSVGSEPGIDEDFRARLLAGDRDLAARLYRQGNALIQRSSRPGGPRRLITVGVPSVGDLMNLNVASGCSGTLDTRVGQVRSIGAHVVVVSDTTNPAGGFTTAQYDSIAAEFDTLAYATDTTNFGGPTDLDSNARVVAFYTRAVNELSPPASSVVTLGFFTARDLFSSAPASCPRSNEGEIFYMLAPDPTGAVNSNVRTVSFVRGSTVGTMAHEFQHLINASRRVYLNGTWSGTLEEVWLNEGLSHIAEELVFYRASVGLAPRQNIIVTNLTTGTFASRRVAAFNTYANANFGRWRGWLQRPDTSGALKNVDALATRGATWSFLRYSADRLNGTDAAFWSALINTQQTGTANLSSALGGADVSVWMRDWIAANYADDAVSGIAAKYTHPSWSYRSLYTALNGSYQLVPRLLANATPLTLSYSRGGGTAYARFGVAASGFASVTALSGGVAPTSPYALIVMRTK